MYIILFSEQEGLGEDGVIGNSAFTIYNPLQTFVCEGVQKTVLVCGILKLASRSPFRVNIASAAGVE